MLQHIEDQPIQVERSKALHELVESHKHNDSKVEHEVQRKPNVSYDDIIFYNVAVNKHRDMKVTDQKEKQQSFYFQFFKIYIFNYRLC